jgi:hypothetical protein
MTLNTEEELKFGYLMYLPQFIVSGINLKKIKPLAFQALQGVKILALL